MEWRPKPAMSFGKPGDPASFGVVFPFSWRHGAIAGQGYVIYRGLGGRVEPVGLSIGDPGTGGAVIPNGPQPRVTTTILRLLPLGAIVAAGGKEAAALRDAVLAAQSLTMALPLTPGEVAEAKEKGIPLLHLQGFTMMNEAEAADAVAAMAEFAALFSVGPGTRRTGPKARPDSHYRAVAAIYSQADRKGRNPVHAVREMYREATGVLVPRSTASRWVRRAEKKGFLGPAPGPGRIGRALPEPPDGDG